MTPAFKIENTLETKNYRHVNLNELDTHADNFLPSYPFYYQKGFSMKQGLVSFTKI